MKSEGEILKKFPGVEDFTLFYSKQFSRCFSSYTQAFNKQQGRMGNLFIKTFKRKHVADENYFRNLVCYIHRNPVEAKMVKHFGDWEFSSYDVLTKEEKTFLKREECISFFEDRQNFIKMHDFSLNGGFAPTDL
jgi:putative transposase